MASQATNSPSQTTEPTQEQQIFPKRYPVYMLRRANNCDCYCGLCSTCLPDEVYYPLIQDHLNKFEECSCKTCKFYREWVQQFNYPIFRYEEDDILQEMRMYYERIARPNTNV